MGGEMTGNESGERSFANNNPLISDSPLRLWARKVNAVSKSRKRNQRPILDVERNLFMARSFDLLRLSFSQSTRIAFNLFPNLLPTQSPYCPLKAA